MRSILSVGVSSFLLGFGTHAASASDATLKDSVPHITTIGHAEIDVVPDAATLYIGVTNDSTTASQASGETAKISAAMIDEIKVEGIDKKDIKTISVSTTPVTEIEKDDKGIRIKKGPIKYKSSVNLRIYIRDVSKAGRLAQVLIEKGANQFSGILFSSSNERQTRRALQGQAMQDALAEAQSYTSSIGLKLGRVIQIGDESASGSGNEADLRLAARAEASPIAIPVEPGVQTLSSTIQVIWQIESDAPASPSGEPARQ